MHHGEFVPKLRVFVTENMVAVGTMGQYKAKIKSPQSLEEIMVILDLIDPKTLSAAKETLRKG